MNLNKYFTKLKLSLIILSTCVLLVGCSTAEEDRNNQLSDLVNSYNSEAECISSGVLTEVACKGAFKEIQNNNFTNQSSCETSGNNCRVIHNSDGSSSWTPFLAGYLISDKMNQWTNSGNSRNSRYYDRPSYSYDTPRSSSSSSSKKASTVKPKPYKPPVTRTKNISRGGFFSSKSKSTSSRSRSRSRRR